MAFTDNTMFEVINSNSHNDQLQNVTGKFGTYADNTYSALDCDAGLLCVPAAYLPIEGYEGYGEEWNNKNLYNKQAYYMISAADGEAGQYADGRTGIYALNSYNVNRSYDSAGNGWNNGRRNLGLGLYADETGTFTEIKIGEKYAFGKGNFSTAPTMGTHPYATIKDGKLVASATAGTAGVYFKIVDSEPVTEGTYNWGDKYILLAVRA